MPPEMGQIIMEALSFQSVPAGVAIQRRSDHIRDPACIFFLLPIVSGNNMVFCGQTNHIVRVVNAVGSRSTALRTWIGLEEW